MQQLIVFSSFFVLMPQKTRSGKHAGEASSGGEGGRDGVMMECMWDKHLVDADYLEELVKTNLSVRVQY